MRTLSIETKREIATSKREVVSFKREVVVSKREAAAASTWFFRPKINQRAKIHLFCFPYAGGNAEIYHSWPDYLPDEIEMIAIQYPGHLKSLGEKPFTRMSALVAAIYDEIKDYFDKPYAFFGHSMGAMITYDLCQYLNSKNAPLPVHIFQAARRAPHIQSIQPALHSMSTAEIISVMRNFSMLPEEIISNDYILQLILPGIIADFEIVETWQYNPQAKPLHVPMTVFCGVNDNQATRNDMEAWRKHTTGEFKIYIYPEQHFFIHHEQIRQNLIRIVAGTLNSGD
jgi:medium-chain acyl-[acyl-carrier-protein] hydrolase